VSCRVFYLFGIIVAFIVLDHREKRISTKNRKGDLKMKKNITKIFGTALLVTVIIIPLISQAQPRGGKGMRGGWGGSSASIKSSPIPKTDEEKQILAVLDNMLQNQRMGMQNVPVEDGRLLRLLAETMNAKNVVEIGTSNGYSALWMLLALRSTGGHLTTFDIDPQRLALARENFKNAGVEKLVTVIEGDAHKEIKVVKGPIDLLFMDADKEGYLDYLEKLMPLVRPGGLIAAHNMNPGMAYPPFVEAITKNPDLETIFLNTHLTGIGVSLKKR